MSDFADQAGQAATRYLAVLQELRVIESTPDGIRLSRSVDSLGPSLEDHVAWVCRHHLGGRAEWGVQLEGLPGARGDFDVLAWLSPILLNVECKTTPPGRIGGSELRHFLQRHVELAPELSVLLVDTDDDLDILLDRVNELLRPIASNNSNPVMQLRYRMLQVSPYLEPHPNYAGVAFGSLLNVYVTSSQPTIPTQLRRCLQHYYALVRGQAIIAPHLLNFIDSDGD